VDAWTESDWALIPVGHSNDVREPAAPNAPKAHGEQAAMRRWRRRPEPGGTALAARSSVGGLTFKNEQVGVDTHALLGPGKHSEWLNFQEPPQGQVQPLSNNVVRSPVAVEVVPLSTVSTSPSADRQSGSQSWIPS
jgi:hypothetical protein